MLLYTHSTNMIVVFPIIMQNVQYPVKLDSLMNRLFRIMGGVYDKQ